MGTFRSEALRRFVIAGEKSSPPVFVGREPILTENLQKASLGFEQGTAPPGNTRIIQGAPGAGKTSILLELERRGQQGDHTPRTVVVTDVEIEQHLATVLKSIALAASAPQKAWVQTVTQIGSYIGARLGTISLFGFSADVARFVENGHPTDLHELGQILPSSQWTHPVILAVDEAQRLRGETATPQAHALTSIHDARQIGLPLTLVFAGLGDTKERINEIGITNGAYAFDVGALAAHEQAQVIEGFCAHFGLTVGHQRNRLYAFFEPTEGWPRHLYWAQRALAEIVLDPAIDGHLDNIPDWTILEHRRDQFRRGYHVDRTSSDMERSNKLVGAIMLCVNRYENENRHLTISALANMVKKYAQRGYEDDAWRIPGHQTVHAYIHHLVHQGALARQTETGTYRCPIPSFQAYLMDRAQFTQEEMRGFDHMIAPTES